MSKPHVDKRLQAPLWLGELARKKYLDLVRTIGADILDSLQCDMVAMMAEAYETYRQASEELAEHTIKTKSMMVQGSTGQPSIHPAFKIQQQATATFLKIAQQLRISLGKEVESKPEVNSKLNSILGDEDE